MHVRLRAVVAATIVGVTTAALACPLPGSYSATITGERAGGSHFARLALYTFTGACDAGAGSGAVTPRSWEWADDGSPSGYSPMGVRVGEVIALPGNTDRSRPIRGLRTFRRPASCVASRAGTWALAGGLVTIAWDGGADEQWRETWMDATLHKLELVGASELASATYLTTGGARDAGAASAGWAFGGPGSDPLLGVPLTEGLPYVSGLIRRHNAWCGPPPGDAFVYETGFNLPLFRITTTGTLRYVADDVGIEVLGYLARARRHDGILSRTLHYQTSHDWDGDGHISDNGGHTYAGLEVLDAAGALRGFVFADSSRADRDGCGADHTISAIWYLDTYDCDALYGVDPTVPGECGP